MSFYVFGVAPDQMMRIHWSNLLIGLCCTLGTLLIPLWVEDGVAVRSNRLLNNGAMAVPGLSGGRVEVGTNPSHVAMASGAAATLTAEVAVLTGKGPEQVSRNPAGASSYLDVLMAATTAPEGGHTIVVTGGEQTVLAQVLCARSAAGLTVLTAARAVRGCRPSHVLTETVLVASHRDSMQLLVRTERCTSSGALCQDVIAEKSSSAGTWVATTTMRDVWTRRGVNGVPIALVVVDLGPFDPYGMWLAARAAVEELTLPDMGALPHIVTRAAIHVYFGTMSSADEARVLAVLREAVSLRLRVTALHGSCPWAGDAAIDRLDVLAADGFATAVFPRLHLVPCCIMLHRAGQPLPTRRHGAAGQSERGHAPLAAVPWQGGMWVQLVVLAVAVGTGCALMLGICRNWVGRKRKGGEKASPR